MKKERHWVLPAIWAILLMLLLGGAVWAYQAFSVADWQSLDPSRLTSLRPAPYTIRTAITSPRLSARRTARSSTRRVCPRTS